MSVSQQNNRSSAVGAGATSAVVAVAKAKTAKDCSDAPFTIAHMQTYMTENTFIL